MKKLIVATILTALAGTVHAAGPLTQLSWIGELPLLGASGPASGLSLLTGLPNLLQLQPSTLPALASDVQPIVADLAAGGLNALSAGANGPLFAIIGSASPLPGLQDLPLGGLAAQFITAFPVVAPLAVQSFYTGTLPDLLAPR